MTRAADGAGDAIGTFDDWSGPECLEQAAPAAKHDTTAKIVPSKTAGQEMPGFFPDE
jgi:hypothetical protein